MRVKCVLCDKIEAIENDKFEAKRLRNRPIHTYMCQSCTDRITERTNERIATGKFKLYQPKQEDDKWLIAFYFYRMLFTFLTICKI